MARAGTKMTLNVKRIINQLMVLRNAAGLRQVDVAERMGSHGNHICRMEKGGQSPQSELLDRWADVFGLVLTVAPYQTTLLDTPAAMGAELRRIRLEKGLALADITEATGIHESNLSAYENGRRHPDTKTLVRIVAALGCRVAIVGAR